MKNQSSFNIIRKFEKYNKYDSKDNIDTNVSYQSKKPIGYIVDDFKNKKEYFISEETAKNIELSKLCDILTKITYK